MHLVGDRARRRGQRRIPDVHIVGASEGQGGLPLAPVKGLVLGVVGPVGVPVEGTTILHHPPGSSRLILAETPIPIIAEDLQRGITYGEAPACRPIARGHAIAGFDAPLVGADIEVRHGPTRTIYPAALGNLCPIAIDLDSIVAVVARLIVRVAIVAPGQREAAAGGSGTIGGGDERGRVGWAVGRGAASNGTIVVDLAIR